MKTIGIIGGMSYESSLHYYERINKQVNENLGGLASPELILYNVNFAKIRRLMVEGNWSYIAVILSQIAKTLENAGADYIAIATNTMHKLADFIEENIDIPLIHIGDSVADVCIKKNVRKVGLIGTRYTMEEEFLIKRLARNGLEVVTPGAKEDIDDIDRIIFEELCHGVTLDKSKDKYLSIISKMIDLCNIEGIILGCTEIGMLINQNDLVVPVFDTTEAHIDSIVDYALEKKHILKPTKNR